MNIISRKVNYSTIKKHGKLKSNFYLSPGLIYEELLLKKDHIKLSNATSLLSNIGVNKRIYTEPEYGIPFVSNSDLTSSNPLKSCKYVSKKFCNLPHRVIKEGMTLVSAIGTIGLVAYASKELNGALTPIGNLIKLYSNKEKYNGFLYAFLKSHVGNSIIQKLVSGSVQSYIDPTTFGNIPIPIFPKEKQHEIHQLIVEAANLHVESNMLLEEADSKLISLLDINESEFKKLTSPKEASISSSFKVSRRDISSLTIRSRGYSKRLELIENVLKKGDYNNLEDLLTKPIAKGGRYKRVEVSPDSVNAIELLNQGDIFNYNPKGRTISKKYIDNLDNQTTRRNMILIPAVGTLGENEIFGRPIMSRGYLEGKVISEHLLRIVPDESLVNAGYLYVVLKSKLWFRILRSIVYGTNLLYFILPMMNKMPIPRFNVDDENYIGNNAKSAFDKRTEALKKENAAINLIEEEIAPWQ